MIHVCSFSIPLRLLSALLPIASTDDTRNSICGIRCEVSPHDADKACVTLVATDGRRLLVLDATEDVRLGSFTGRCDFTIPSHVLHNVIASQDEEHGGAHICHQDGSNVAPSLHIHLEQFRADNPDKQLLTLGMSSRLSCPIYSFERYPDWRRVVPHSLKAIPNDGIHTFNPEMLADFGAAFRELFKSDGLCLYVPFHLGPAEFEAPPYVVLPSCRQWNPFRCLGLIMPRHGSDTEGYARIGEIRMPMLAHPDSRAHGHYVPPSVPLL